MARTFQPCKWLKNGPIVYTHRPVSGINDDKRINACRRTDMNLVRGAQTRGGTLDARWSFLTSEPVSICFSQRMK